MNAAKVKRASIILRAVPVGDDNWAHYAEETRRYYIITEEELEKLCDYIDSGDDGYSRWCAEFPGEEQPQGWEPPPVDTSEAELIAAFGFSGPNRVSSFTRRANSHWSVVAWSKQARRSLAEFAAKAPHDLAQMIREYPEEFSPEDVVELQSAPRAERLRQEETSLWDASYRTVDPVGEALEDMHFLHEWERDSAGDDGRSWCCDHCGAGAWSETRPSEVGCIGLIYGPIQQKETDEPFGLNYGYE